MSARAMRAWLLSAAWMVFIFIMSATPGDLSGKESKAVVQLVVNAIETVTDHSVPLEGRAFLEFIVRKAAHMMEYAVLYLLYRHALLLSGNRKPAIAALLLCAAYAVTDEFHQGFVDGRGSSPIDVLIDTAGAALGACVAFCAAEIREKLCDHLHQG